MNISSFQKCANCGACSNLCPHGAITVTREGLFYKPVVDEDKCTHCGLCSRKCPLNGETTSFAPMYACAGWHKSPQVVHNSSSGGAFHGLAEDTLAQGGVVFGAAYTGDCREVRFASTDDTPLAQLRKSKYMESLTSDSFMRVRDALKAGRPVLFCGTPCQVAGLYAFLGKRPEKLLTCDFACGGLPSHKIYQNYLQVLEQKYGAPVVSMDFRPKTHGWRRYAVLAKFRNGKVYNRLGTEDPYLRSFLYGKYTVRNDCLDCKFSDHHAADLTIADFWLNTRLSGPDNPDGVSLILCKTPAGRQAVERIRGQYELREVPVAEASYNHKPTETSPEKRAQHDAFLRLCEEKGLDAACREYLPMSAQSRLKNYVRRILCRSGGQKHEQ